MAKIKTPANFLGGQEVAENSLSVVYGDPLSLKSGFLAKAVAGDKIEGYSVETVSVESDNETVVRQKIEFARSHDDMVVTFDVTNGALTQALVGTTFNLAADGTVDGATSGAGDQLILRKMLTAQEGDFVRNK